ncbi:AAA family ATPase [Cytophagales bacterium LB-30]|uniref:AAA family ATPase n=1 Tax=Shiella aurantiaca TaxID=3058365 RepID=A0ABT8F542_9BACT|nr:AAA family ATPase [Shiella aurantiaca]MDN4165515.1 AAA family ATPase [Shiella aurantiaca]
MLQNIKIEGFKSIKTMELKLNPINLLIGSNGVGKSNFISFFKLVNNIYEQRLQQYSLKSGLDSLLHFGRKNTSEIMGYLDFGNNAYMFTLLPTDEGSMFISREDSLLNYQTQFNRTFYNENIKESLIKGSSTTRDKYLSDHLESYKIYHFHDTSESAPLRSAANINDNRSLKENGSNLAPYLYYLQEKHPMNFKRIEKTIQSMVPFFEKFDLAPRLLDENKIELEWREKEHPESYFSARHLSDGSLRFIALVTLLMQPKLPKVIIIDEPELGLHPTAINKLSGLIKSAAAKECQIIISTQSVTLLNNFEAEDIITVDKENNQSVFRRLDKELLSNWIEDYSIGELWTKSIIKGQPL